ncbi:MAG: hypothetical protein JNJ54_33960 [Myxococcaceae bacterium]|nr:hypothetical protein [Myxococcaceae bacterium]
MPKWLKVVLVVLLALAGLCGLGVGGIAWWFGANKDQLRADGQRIMAEAKAFGATTDADGCVTKSLERLEAADGFIAQAEQKVFLRTCLENTLARPDFCEHVPAMSELMAAATWSVANCNERHARDPQACGRLLQAVMEFCEKDRRREQVR